MEQELKLKTHWKPQLTKVQFGVGCVFETHLPSLLEKEERKCVIVTDSNLEKLYGKELEKFDCKVFSFLAGEASKTRETKLMLEDHMLAHKFGRDSLVIGLGGGVVGDVSGYLAATYCRGVAHVQIPTSLLGMVDASIGGKTAVNTPYGKNMIGTFHPPREVWIDGSFLKTLPKSEWVNGFVEILKAGLIISPPLFQAMHEGVEKWDDLEFAMDRIYESVTIKRDVVEEDPKEEKGLRRVLNLGHTFGHAIETLEEFTIPHGVAVAIGILVSCFISVEMGLIGKDTCKEIEEVFKLYSIPLRLNKAHSIEDLMSLLALDKKALKASPRFVLLSGIGEVASFGGEYCSEVEFPLLEKALEWMNANFTN
ncbi:MAG: 3-dehydroquinate synthase [Simkaniaceae bacterium]|nr:3-dehydroquinate synthase [Candidatus Sacchlamyda saccharinae]